jgi:hypothetical protein
MCTVLLPRGVNLIAVNKYIISNKQIVHTFASNLTSLHCVLNTITAGHALQINKNLAADSAVCALSVNSKYTHTHTHTHTRLKGSPRPNANVPTRRPRDKWQVTWGACYLFFSDGVQTEEMPGQTFTVKHHRHSELQQHLEKIYRHKILEGGGGDLWRKEGDSWENGNLWPLNYWTSFTARRSLRLIRRRRLKQFEICVGGEIA